jgi:glutamate carboxypeptidase
MAMDTVLNTLRAWQDEIIEDIKKFVEIESPSGDQHSLMKAAAFIIERFQSIGAEVKTLVNPDPSVCDHVLVKWRSHASSTASNAKDKRILLIGHFDTVHPIGSFNPVFRQEGELAYGPGILDMKSGIIMALYALRALKQCKLSSNIEVFGLFTTDEEVGSTTSREYIENLAKTSDAVLVLEPAAGDGMLKTARKGVGDYEITAYGKAAHAGLDHQNGVNAIIELSHQMIRAQNLTDYDKGTTVSVGIVSGGSRSNVVPDQAKAIVDVRVKTMEEAERIDRELNNAKPMLEGARVEITGGINRPPMERTEGVVQLYQLARKAGLKIGIDLQETAVGGGSDGNFTAGLGIPTLDGLGPVGDGAHTLHEHIRVTALPERIAILVGLLQEIASLN